ncbi:PAS domain-containing sensor histidine kinase [Aliiroseovarius subalbicans]|uniref:hybrid sensor histidine kinase/response regulator n=1 Tax=Aliiroseovarius subalbicans TaxID=2925840 RepID=UPI001F57F157|nr:PAS domain-containing sensor histidine kinase [Aliiroseovarius subalbicans]
MPFPIVGLALLMAGLTVLTLAFLIRLIALRHTQVELGLFQTVSEFVEHDAAPSFTTDADGQIGYQNAAAIERFGGKDGETLISALGDLFASPGAVLYRLQNKAQAKGAAREDVVLRRGHMRLSVHQVGEGGFLWRLEDMGDRGPAGRTGENISLPMMTVSKTGTILFMNEALRRLLGGRETTLDRVFTDLPVRAGEVMQVAGKDGPVRAMISEIASSAGRRELYLLPEPTGTIVKPGEWGVVDGLPVPLLKLNADGQIVMANRRARALLDDEDAVGSLLSDQVEGLGRPVSEWLREAYAGRLLGRSEVVRATKPEEEVFLQISLGQVVEEDGTALVAVLHDATELKTLEAQFVQSQKMQAIGQLAGGVAHDFNNLLTAISGHCDLLLLGHDENDPEYADLAQIHQNANRAASLVAQLLAFSRKQTLRPEKVDLTDSLSDLTHLLNRLVGEKVRLDLSHDTDLLPIRADKRQLDQVLMNLVVNARDAMVDGGEIRIETRNVILDQGLNRDRATVPAGEYVTVKVIDQGCGIPADKVQKIFEPFFTTKRAGQGTGLGLSMAYGIIKQTGGFIFVDSIPGTGTTFTLYFPIYSAKEGDETKNAEDTATRETPDVVVLDPSAEVEALPDVSTVEPAFPTKPVFETARDVTALTPMAQPPCPAVTEPVQEMTAVDLDQPMDTGPDFEQNAGAPADELLGPDPETDLLAAVQQAAGSALESSPDLGESPEDGLPKPTHIPATEGGIVLLVEDEAPVRAFASRALRMRGYTVLEAENAEEALKTLEDANLNVDVFVTDVIMPGMDGPTWVAQALQDRPGVRVVFVSGYAEDSVAEHQARIPNSVFLPKPFSLSELTDTVQRQLH